MSPQSYEGRCHCGELGFTFFTARAPSEWAIRACQCSFCRSHNARTTTDSEGSVTFAIRDHALLQRYRFGLGTADFLVCRRCGIYLAAVLSAGELQYATLNVNAIDPAPDVPPAQPASYDGESSEERQVRRAQRWTPVSGGL